ncbi:MAG TPA: glycosyltransferase family 39 protein, partial [Acidimicrobiia bacterium]
MAWALLVVGLLVLARLAFRGWIPHDEGTLGQAATRVLGGEVPHVDFHDTYGGLQAYAHAGVFSLIGESIRSLRIANIVVAAVAAYASFTIVRRVQPVVVAASAGVAAMLVGFAVYPASMPSWWNVALGLASAALVLRWLDSRNSTLLAAAGLLTGVNFLVKPTGAYFAAAIALYLMMLVSPDSPKRRTLVALGAVIVLSFGVLLTGAPSLLAVALLLVPLALVAFVGFRMESVPRMPGGQVVPLSSVAMFSLAVVVPIGIFALPYVLSGNGDALISGWLRLPQLRFDSAAWSRSIPLLPLLLLSAVGVLTYWACRRINPRFVLVAWVVLSIVVASIGWQWWWTLVVILIMLTPVAISAGTATRGWHSR